MGAAPPWGQSLLRSCLAPHSFPPPPPATCYPHSNDRSLRRVYARNSQCISNPIGSASTHVQGGRSPIKRGWGREGVRSEARAKQRLAPGGRSPHNPDQVRLLLLLLV